MVPSSAKPAARLQPPASKLLILIGDAVVTLALLGVLFIFYGIIPNRWYHILVVNSGSMAPTFRAGDLIVITRPPEKLETGMILTLLIDGELVTHRLAGMYPDEKVITIGDANATFDDWGDSQVSVHGLYRFRIPYLGFVLQFMPDLGDRKNTGSWFVDNHEIALAVFSLEGVPLEGAPLPAITPFEPAIQDPDPLLATPTPLDLPEEKSARQADPEIPPTPTHTPLPSPTAWIVTREVFPTDLPTATVFPPTEPSAPTPEPTLEHPTTAPSPTAPVEEAPPATPESTPPTPSPIETLPPSEEAPPSETSLP